MPADIILFKEACRKAIAVSKMGAYQTRALLP